VTEADKCVCNLPRVIYVTVEVEPVSFSVLV